MQRYFLRNFKRYFFNGTTLIAIISGLICLVVSYLIRNFDVLNEYFNPHINSIELQGLELPAKLRMVEDSREHIFVHLFNFEWFIRSAQWIYLYLINVLVVFPVIKYYDMRKTGYIKAVFLRTEYKRFIWNEALSITLTGGLIAFIPYFIYWLAGAIFIPSNLGEDMGVVSSYFRELYDFNPFSFLHHSVEQLKWYWLVFIIIVGVYGMCISFLAFVFANIVNKKAVLYIVPFIYYYAVNTLFNFMGIELYSIVGLMGYFGHANSSLPNILFPIIMLLMISMIIFLTKVNKEEIVNG